MIGIRRIDEKWWRADHTRFFDDGPHKPGAKTRKFDVFGLTHRLLGHVKWWGAWRKYCFFPLDSMLFDNHCLNQIAEFCTLVTREHKDALPKKMWAKRRLKEQRERNLARIAKKNLTEQENNVNMVIESLNETNLVEE